MPAALRGAGAEGSKPRTRTSAKAQRQPGRSAPAGASKLRAAKGAGLSPTWAAAGAALVLVAGATVMLATGHRGERLAHAGHHAVDSEFASAGFALQHVQLTGVSPAARADVMAAARVYHGQPLLSLDLDQVRQRVEQVGWVRQARVVRLLPDTIRIVVDERSLLAVWEHAGHTVVVDRLGQPVPEADPRHFANLPLIVGAGAPDSAAQVLGYVAQHPRVVQRLDALVRVDDRRWDLRLRDGAIIQLPQDGEEAALIQLDQLDRRSRVLDLGLARIDLRDPDMVAVRPRPAVAPSQPPTAEGVG
jgi:cell division protein FtsQ